MNVRLYKLDDDVKAGPDVPGNSVTVNVPDVPAGMKGIPELIDWLKNNPEFLALLIAAFLALLGGAAPPRTAA